MGKLGLTRAIALSTAAVVQSVRSLASVWGASLRRMAVTSDASLYAVVSCLFSRLQLALALVAGSQALSSRFKRLRSCFTNIFEHLSKHISIVD